MSVQAFDDFNDAILAAHKASRENQLGYAFAIQWPLGHSTVETRKPSLRSAQMRVICCERGTETLA